MIEPDKMHDTLITSLLAFLLLNCINLNAVVSAIAVLDLSSYFVNPAFGRSETTWLKQDVLNKQYERICHTLQYIEKAITFNSKPSVK